MCCRTPISFACLLVQIERTPSRIGVKESSTTNNSSPVKSTILTIFFFLLRYRSMQWREDRDVLQVVTIGERKGRGVFLASRNSTTEVHSEITSLRPFPNPVHTKKGKGKRNKQNQRKDSNVIPEGTPLYFSSPDIAVLYSCFARMHCSLCFSTVEDEKIEHKKTLVKEPTNKGNIQCPSHSPGTLSKDSTKDGDKSGYACPTCEEFLLCSSCVAHLVSEVQSSERETKREESVHSTSSFSPCTLASHEEIATTTEKGSCSSTTSLLKSSCATAEEGSHNGHPAAGSTTIAPTTTDVTSPASPLPTLTWMDTLLLHPMLRLHRTSCDWYNELPSSVREPGKDTDYLRFCLLYGAFVLYAEKEKKKEEEEEAKMEGAREADGVRNSALIDQHSRSLRQRLARLNGLEDNLSSQDSEVIAFCSSFAKDKVVKTFGPVETTGCAAPPLNISKETSSSPSAKMGPSGSTLSLNPCLADHGGVSSVPPTPRYPVSGEDLSSMLLKTRCNSLGFPFTTEETIGWSVDGFACMINHSCEPNAAIVHADRDEAFLSLPSSSNSYLPLTGCFGIKSIRPIYENDEITISYLDEEGYDDDVDRRTRALLDLFRFLCTCPKCLRQREARRANKEMRIGEK